MNNLNPNADRPETVTEKGALVHQRFPVVSKARSTLAQLDAVDVASHADDRNKIQGQIDGNRPYNQARLKANGQAGRCNVNWRQAEATRDTNMSANWNMILDVPAFVTLTPNFPGMDPFTSDKIAQTIAEEYTNTLLRWKGFFYAVNLQIQELQTFGIGLFYWPNKIDWRPQSCKRGSIRFRMAAKSNPEDMDLIYVRDTMQPYEFFKILENEAVSAKMGWNTNALKSLLIRRYINKDLQKNNPYSVSDEEKLQYMIKNGDMNGAVDELNDIEVVRMIVREPTGKVSLYLFDEDAQTDDYLFEAPECLDAFTSAAVMFFYTIGDGTAGSVRGLGHRMFASVEYNNRLTCGIMDGAWLGSSMVVQNNASDNRLMTVERIGPLTILPKNVVPVQNQYSPQLEGLIAVRNMIDQIQNESYGVYKRNTSGSNEGPRTRTARGEQISLEKDTQLYGFQVGNYYEYWTILHKEIFRRLLGKTYPQSAGGYEEREDFIKRCTDRGIPRDMLDPDKWVVDAVRAVGNGSSIMQKILLGELSQIVPQMDEIGKQNWMIDFTAARVGHRRTERYVSGANRNRIPTSETSFAAMENILMSKGEKGVEVGVEQNHVLHSQKHIEPLQETVQAYINAKQSNQPIDPRELLPFWQTASEHISEHVQNIADDPTHAQELMMIIGFMKQIAPVMREAMQDATRLANAEAKQQQAEIAQQEAQGQLSAAMQLKAQELQAKLELQAQDKASIAQQRQLKTEQTLRQKEIAFQQKMRHKMIEDGDMSGQEPGMVDESGLQE